MSPFGKDSDVQKTMCTMPSPTFLDILRCFGFE